MNSRERINTIFNRAGADRCGLWLGNPDKATVEIYTKALGLSAKDELFSYFNDDCRWVLPEHNNAYKHPQGKPMWDLYEGRKALAERGLFADCEDPAEVDKFAWPSARYLDFTQARTAVLKCPDKAVFSGMWTCFFHAMCDFFGMEEYFMKMHTNPDVVEAATEHAVNFYLEANEKYFNEVPEFDIFFMGNDFGSQLDLLVSPEMFKKFILPGFIKNINLAKKYGKKVMLHSCGSISRIIPLLIDAGVDAIHPIQAKAAGMDAVSLAKQYKGKITFVGGVDTQELLVNATPAQVKDEVKRLKDVLGPDLVISPSHEAVLPNVPLANIEAMVLGALEQ